CQHSYGAPYSF
nr:immunoglobulin light chain junction region [Macaca mulatta]MOV77592.1 immunoglobulin light chain junction region [Macaca mulatta]MOV81241.1 immunoglobulin light chain junction region [Macaca mulatta]MOW14743.1 immunoglobulin light chain junction region [Macaca mulatta]